MMPQIGYYSNIPGWKAIQIAGDDEWPYRCWLCKKAMHSGDWVLLNVTSNVFICGVMDDD